MKKILTALAVTLLVAISALTLVSCQDLFGGDDPIVDNTDKDKGKFNQIVIYDSEMDILNIRSAVFDLKGTMPVVTPDKETAEREIVLGDTDRAVTAAAKAELAAQKAGKSGTHYGYIIYFDGKSVAVYWEHENLMTLALDKFLEKCIDEKQLMLDSGAVASAVYSQKETEQEVIWMAIENTVDAELYAALHRFANEFDGTRYAEWLANLWDNDEGGLYYSNSARDYVGFLPDIESTAQGLSFLNVNKALTDVNAQLPNEIKIKIVDFFLDRQDTTDGYFYHPQWAWGKDKLSSDRYGRDLGSATGWISRLTVDRNGDGIDEKVYPKVCTPNGYKCAEHAEGGVCSFIGAAALKTDAHSSVSAAVSHLTSSTVKPTASASAPDFSSASAFVAWLSSYTANIKTDPGTTSHYINALAGEIEAHGYADELLDYLDRIQKEVYDEQKSLGQTPSGFWAYDASHSLAMAIHKYMSEFYNDSTYGREFKYHKEAINTCIDILLLDADGIALNMLMNQWISITHIFTNAKKYNPDDVPELYEMVRARGVELVEKANANLETNRIGDCMYSYSNGRSLVNIYGVNVSLGLREADVNGLLLIGNYYNAVFGAMNLPVVPLCSSSDGELFVDTVLSLEPFDKLEVPRPTAIDFEDKTLSQIPEVTIVKNTSTGKIEIIEDPLGEQGKILSFYSPQGTPTADFLNVQATDNGGNCNIVELDFMIAETSINTEIYQVFLDNAFMLTIFTNGEYLRIDVISDGVANPLRDTLVDYSDKIRVDMWHKLRFEAYDPDEEITAPILKVFVDNELMGESSIFYRSDSSGAVYSGGFAWFKIYSKAGVVTTTYVDNIYCSRETKTYTEGDDTSDLRDK